MDDSGSTPGDDGIGEDDTNVTFLVGDTLFPLPDPALGVFNGDRRHDFVGDM